MAEPETPEPDRLPGVPHPREAPAVYGQGAAERAVAAALRSGRVHHAWLLAGPMGIGKASLAYRLAGALIAGDGAGLGGVPEPEGCPVRRRIRAGSEPGLRVLRRELAPKTKPPRLRTQIVVDDLRALKQSLALSAPDGGRRVVIVDHAEEMTPSAANALLKLLEEPPAGVVMLLVSHAPGRLLPTIRSRCRRLDLAPLGAEDLARALAGAGRTVDPARAAALAELAGGSAGRAVLLEAGEGLAHYAAMVALLEGGRVDRAGLAALADAALRKDADGRPVFPLLCDLAVTLAGRLARAGALGPPEAEAAPGERAAMARLAPDAAAARAWAEAAGRLSAAARHAQAVNLDPAQTMLDMFLDLDETIAAAAAPAP